MKHLLLTTIAAVLFVGCAAVPKIYYDAAGGNIEEVKLHLAAGADVNAKIRGGITLLHSATANGHKEITELLIDNGADVNAKTKDGRTPLDSALSKPLLANLLRKHGGKTGEELKADGK